ncbi:MAG: hypothetical protein FRX49_13053 [Trebouxia sp. A1-2]|nr:MAG: hypothetical protein FRX49_13053 [Trebouxia sp. A1-2]
MQATLPSHRNEHRLYGPCYLLVLQAPQSVVHQPGARGPHWALTTKGAGGGGGFNASFVRTKKLQAPIKRRLLLEGSPTCKDTDE